MKSVDEYFKILGVDSTATPEQLKKAYRKLIKEWHPDRFLHNPRLYNRAQEKLREINKAYDEVQSLITHQKDRLSGASDDLESHAEPRPRRTPSGAPERPVPPFAPSRSRHARSWRDNFLQLRRLIFLTVKDPLLIAAFVAMMVLAIIADWLTK
jgi:hypothetical protein